MVKGTLDSLIEKTVASQDTNDAEQLSFFLLHASLCLLPLYTENVHSTWILQKAYLRLHSFFRVHFVMLLQ